MALIRFALVALLALPVFVQAESYGLSPGATIKLGSAYDPVNPERTFANAFYKAGAPDKSAGASSDFSAQMYEIASAQSLNESLQLDAYAKARYGAFKAKGSYSRLRSMEFNERTLNIALVVRKTFTPDSFESGIGLSETGKFFLNTKVVNVDTADQFLNVGGSEVVSTITKGGVIYVVYQFKARDSSTRDRISAAFSASYAGTSAGVSSLNEIIRNNSNLRVEWNVITEGVDDKLASDSIGALITSSAGDVPAVKQAMAKLVNSVNYASAKVLAFTTTPVSEIADIQFSPAIKWFDGYNARVLERKNDVLSITNMVQKLDDQIDTADYLLKAPKQYLHMPRFETLASQKDVLEKAKAQLLKKMANFGPGQTLEDFSMPKFEPMRYVKFPLAVFSGYADDPVWGGRESCGAGDGAAQCQNLTWSFAPKFAVSLPGVLKKVSFKALDGSYVHTYDLTREAATYGLSVKDALPDGYYTFRRFRVNTWGGNNVAGSKARPFALANLDAAFADRRTIADKDHVLEMEDIAGKTMRIAVPQVSRFQQPLAVQPPFDPMDYKGTLWCENLASCSIR